ncbi:hypothetical protein TWF694_011012 [Orbilia ellipsospora]|uniref:Uncharacterized protein n=1 Tax=Orbilia ellipsospora TaxID=2528407 RepID=A0AAV9X7T5_9PEZI
MTSLFCGLTRRVATPFRYVSKHLRPHRTASTSSRNQTTTTVTATEKPPPSSAGSSNVTKTPSPQPTAKANTISPLRTFQLCELSTLFGRDSHYLLFIQREGNAQAIDNFKSNLSESISHHEVKFFPRVYTDRDIVNFQESCLDIFGAFDCTNDCVGILAILGTIKVEPLVDVDDSETENNKLWDVQAKWFYEVFDDAKFPEWASGFSVEGDQVIDLQEDEFVPLKAEV